MNAPIIVEETINAPAEKIWQALTNNEQMKHWYFNTDFQPEVGHEFQFSGGKDDRTYLHLCRVTEVVPQRKLTHSWRYNGYDGESYVTFELLPEGESTKVKLTHQGLETFPSDNPDFAKENFVAGWTHIIKTSLKNFVEKQTT